MDVFDPHAQQAEQMRQLLGGGEAMNDGMCPDQLQERADADFSAPITSRMELRDKIYRIRMDLITLEEVFDSDGTGGYTELRRITLSHLRQSVIEIEATP